MFEEDLKERQQSGNEEERFDKVSFQNEKPIKKNTSFPKKRMKPKNSQFLKSFLTPLLASLLGVLLGALLILEVFPRSALFEQTTLARRLSTGDEVDAKKEEASIKQKEVVTEKKEVDLAVEEIVSQYQNSVVTVLAHGVPDNEGAEEENPSSYIGSGFIINGEGLIATNQHVIQGAQSISVMLSSGEEVEADLLNQDVESDLAIIKLSKKINLPGVVTLGDSDAIEVGEKVIAIGSPISRTFAGSVTSGIISGKNRSINIGQSMVEYLQTDAAMNEGNSGGPIFNGQGQVIGISTAKMPEKAESIGLAIPINVLKAKIKTLSRAPIYLGIAPRDLTQESRDQLGITYGIIALSVEDESAAATAGVTQGDIILKLNGVKIKNTTHFNQVKESFGINESVPMDIMRGNQIIRLMITMRTKQ